ncbi:hypothetical protein WBK31_07695 [Nonomuraea sp. N2-4H]|uniref:hypothetical protein n=1 Tax=Nonomuraea sp. N2-4H TaxID=3128898 RepID=UPI00324F5F97
MATRRGYAWSSLAICVAIVLSAFLLHGVFGEVGLLYTVLLIPMGLAVFIVAHDVLSRRNAAAAERRRLAGEREHVRRTVDFIADPDLTEQQRLAVIDALIPRVRRVRDRQKDRYPDPHEDPFTVRYVIVSELSPPARALLERARRAVTSVYASRAMRLRLLDGPANEMLLPRQIWEIALLLRAQTRLWQEQERAMSGVVTPELRAVLEPQQEALRRSAAAVKARVERLERYARRVAEADAALRARDALAANHKYRALLARTDDAEGPAALEAQAEALEETLARSVREAAEAGHTLTMPAAP